MSFEVQSEDAGSATFSHAIRRRSTLDPGRVRGPRCYFASPTWTLNFVRHKVSGNRRRWVSPGFDLDLTWISSGVIAMGFPAQGLAQLWYNPINQVRKFIEFLDDHYGNVPILVLNLCESAVMTYNPCKLRPAGVMLCPFKDHTAPPMGLQIEAAIMVCSWNIQGFVTMVHCKAGKGRTGTIICSALILVYWALLTANTLQNVAWQQFDLCDFAVLRERVCEDVARLRQRVCAPMQQPSPSITTSEDPAFSAEAVWREITPEFVANSVMDWYSRKRMATPGAAAITIPSQRRALYAFSHVAQAATSGYTRSGMYRLKSLSPINSCIWTGNQNHEAHIKTETPLLKHSPFSWENALRSAYASLVPAPIYLNSLTVTFIPSDGGVDLKASATLAMLRFARWSIQLETTTQPWGSPTAPVTSCWPHDLTQATTMPTSAQFSRLHPEGPARPLKAPSYTEVHNTHVASVPCLATQCAGRSCRISAHKFDTVIATVTDQERLYLSGLYRFSLIVPTKKRSKLSNNCVREKASYQPLFHFSVDTSVVSPQSENGTITCPLCHAPSTPLPGEEKCWRLHTEDLDGLHTAAKANALGGRIVVELRWLPRPAEAASCPSYSN